MTSAPSGTGSSDVDFVYEQVEQHHGYFGRALPMIASENCISPLARRLLASDFHDRYAEGRPGKRYYQGLQFIDQVEERCEALAAELFDARYTDTRPTAGTTANIGLFFALAKPGETLMALDTAAGAHISHARFGAAGVRGLNIEVLPADPSRMTVDPEASAEAIRATEPRIVTVGQSLFLFPAPVAELVDACREVGATLHYDGAHVLGLIGGGAFQDPLGEGADVLTASTHKTLPGPQGGVVLSRRDPVGSEEDAAFCKRLDRGIFPGVVSSHHLHHLAAKAVAFAEHIAFGEEYARTIIASSKALAEALAAEGFEVACEDQGYTESHQVAVGVGEQGGGKHQAQRLEDAGIVCNMNMLPGDTSPMKPSGLRLGTQELARIGMGPGEMQDVAVFLRRVVLDDEEPVKVARDVEGFRKAFQNVHYCFGPERAAYTFWDLTDAA